MASNKETRIESACRHIREAHQRIEDQLALIEEMIADGHDPHQAEILLATYIQVLDTLKERLTTLRRTQVQQQG